MDIERDEAARAKNTRRFTRTAAVLSLLIVVAAGIGLAFLFVHSNRQPDSLDEMWAQWMAENRESSIDENVPGPEEFDALLTRDLEAYFRENTGRKVSVSYELLRDWPSQSGLGYPKYYAWVRLFDGSDFVEEGVVRVGVMGKERFYVTHYFTADAARRSPEAIREVFAEDVVQEIERRLK